MTDPYENIRRALEKGPTPGPWRVNTSGVGVKGGKVELTEFYVYNPAIVDDVAIAADIIDPTTCKPSEANAAHIAACDPDTIRALLAERDALARDACVALVADIRFACGDNGKRMQPELVEFIRGLAADSARYQWLRARWGRIAETYEDDRLAFIGDEDAGEGWDTAPDSLDAAIDAAIDQARGEGVADA